jgi:hypothetical protein
MKKKALTLLTLCLALPVFAQDDYKVVEQAPTIGIAFQPQSFSYNAAEIDLDIRLKERQWLTIAPRIQFGNPEAETYFSDAVSAIKNGVGLGLTYRYFPLTRYTRKRTDGKGPFVSVGLDYLRTNYHYLGKSQVPYVDEYGVQGFTIDYETPYDETVQRFGGAVNIGYAWRIFDILYMEGFMGVGTRYSDYTYQSDKGRNLGEHAWDTGFSGYCMTGGFRVGVYLNRYRYTYK